MYRSCHRHGARAAAPGTRDSRTLTGPSQAARPGSACPGTGRATGHWLHLDPLRGYGAEPQVGRWVEDGKLLTAAGVSAGIDMALHLVGREAGTEVAQAIQLMIEYDPQPPFDAGSPAKAPAPIVEAMRSRARG